MKFEDDDEEKFNVNLQVFDQINTGIFIHNKTGGDGILGLAPRSKYADLRPFDFMDQLVANG